MAFGDDTVPTLGPRVEISEEELRRSRARFRRLASRRFRALLDAPPMPQQVAT